MIAFVRGYAAPGSLNVDMIASVSENLHEPGWGRYWVQIQLKRKSLDQAVLPLVLLWFFSKVAAFSRGSAAAGSLNADMTASAAMSSVNQVDEAIRGRRGLVDFPWKLKVVYAVRY